MSQRRRTPKRPALPRREEILDFLRRPETFYFVLANVLDYLTTYAVVYTSHMEASPLQRQLVESNPVAAYFIDRWGLEKGLAGFKFGLVAAILLVTYRVAHRQPRTARWVLNFGTLITGAVVVYSLSLLIRHWR